MRPARIPAPHAPALLAAALLAMAGCAPVPSQAVPPHPFEPPPVSEFRPKPPVSYRPLVWQPGHHDWNGSTYRWIPGRYIDRAAAGGAMWQQGYWTYRGAPPSGGWVWLPAHWR